MPTPSFSRRRFLQTAATGAVVGPSVIALSGQTPATSSEFPAFFRGEVVRTGGEITSGGRFREAAREIGFSTIVEAEKHTLEGIVAALAAHFEERR